MTGRGFRDESCSRGLSTVTVENVRFASSFDPLPPPRLHLVLIQLTFISTNPSRDVSNNTFLSLIVEPSILLRCLYETRSLVY